METERPKNTWGGKRAGAGRPKTSPFVPHEVRPDVDKRCPIRVTLKLRSGFPSLRSPELYSVFAKAAHRARRFGVRIIEFTVLAKAIHMIVEVKSKEELERSFKSLNTTMAIALKKAREEETHEPHEGPVFLGRFHMELLETPDQLKAALRDVLTLEAQVEGIKPFRDPYSSAIAFEQWGPLLGHEWHEALATVPEDLRPQHATAVGITASPQFWLTKHGWLKA
jgi:hypothetical protein